MATVLGTLTLGYCLLPLNIYNRSDVSTKMAQRLELLQQQIGSPKAAFVESSFDYLNLSSMLTKEENVPMALQRM